MTEGPDDGKRARNNE